MNILLPTSLFLTLFLTLAQAQNQPIKKDDILRDLENIQKGREAKVKADLNNMLNEIAKGAASPSAAISFYENVCKAVEFEGKARDNQEFRDWQEKNREKFRNKNFQLAVQLHLQYLSLLLQKEIEGETPNLVASGLAYWDALHQHEKEFQEEPKMFEELLMKDEALPKSPFVQLYQLERLGNEKPGNLDQLADKLLFPLLRKTKDKQLINLWDERINSAKNKAEKVGTDDAKIRFQTMTEPRLRWRRAKDLCAIGDANTGTAEMYNLIKNYQTHPDAEGWIGELRERLNK